MQNCCIACEDITVSSAWGSVRFTFNFIPIETVQFNKRDPAWQALSGRCVILQHLVISLVWSVFIFSPQLQCNWPSLFFLSAHCMLKIDCISHHNRSCRCEEISHVRLETNQSTNQHLPHFSTNRELKYKTFCSDTFAAAIKFIHRMSQRWQIQPPDTFLMLQLYSVII